jgi:putative tryptophan/tyrosine transport system substrate-binding protein
MTKRRTILALVILAAVVGALAVYGLKARRLQSHLPKVCITQIATHPGIDAIRQSFIEELSHRGLASSRDILFDESNAQGDVSTAQTIARRLATDTCALIFAISTPSSQAVAQAIKGTNVPLVFGAVTDPVAAGLVDTLAHPGRNITGTSDQWPVKEQFQLLRRLVPSAERIGVVFNPGEANADANLKTVEGVAHELGVQIVKVAVASTNEVQSAAASLVGRCDAIYVPADNTVIAAMEAIVRVSEQNKIPLLPGVSSNVQQGGFGTLGPDYSDIGKQSASIAFQILNGAKAESIAVAVPRRFEYFFNLKSAKATGVEIPADLLKKATTVFP